MGTTTGNQDSQSSSDCRGKVDLKPLVLYNPMIPHSTPTYSEVSPTYFASDPLKLYGTKQIYFEILGFH